VVDDCDQMDNGLRGGQAELCCAVLYCVVLYCAMRSPVMVMIFIDDDIYYCADIWDADCDDCS
jgi:hypothetical protein